MSTSGTKSAPAYAIDWPLWSAGLAAFVLCGIAFVLWGINGPATLLDMIVALCF